MQYAYFFIIGGENMEYVTKTITIKRRINPDERLINFIRYNSERRRRIWNKFVEEYKLCKHNGDRINLVKFTTKMNDAEISDLQHAIETGNDNVVKMYCSDLTKSVYSDMKSALRMMHTKFLKDGIRGELHFKSYDAVRHSFSVRSDNAMGPKTGSPRGKVIFTDTNHMVFKASYNYTKNTFDVLLTEPISDEYDSDNHRFINYKDKYSSRERYDFHHDDIKKISFVEDLGKFYIMLVCDVTYYNYKNDFKQRKLVAGLDLGVHNPVTMYDGTQPMYIRMSDNALRKLSLYERKCSTLEQIMNRKKAINIQRHKSDSSYPIYTHNFEKVHRKYRKYYRRIHNIRMDWRNKLASIITTRYSTIVVDEFVAPIQPVKNSMPRSVVRKLNHASTQHAMYLFMETLRHCALKNGCTYIDSPKFTTRRCSECYHINQPLPLGRRMFKCENCGNTIDRDENAAKNCYDAYIHKHRWSFD